MKEIPAYLQRDCHWMRQALEEAHKAAELHEIPVGAVIVYQNEIIARAHNRRELDQDALAHAEVLCIQQACQKLGSWRLSGCELYVTLEPCPMCSGAIINARLDRVVYGAKDEKPAAAAPSLTCLLCRLIILPLFVPACLRRNVPNCSADFLQSYARKNSFLTAFPSI